MIAEDRKYLTEASLVTVKPPSSTIQMEQQARRASDMFWGTLN